MGTDASVAKAGESLLEGIPVITADTHGHHSIIQQAALAAYEAKGITSGHCAALALTPQDVALLYYESKYWLRPVQRPPAHYRTWFFMGGRGTGKTYAGAAAVIDEARADPEARILIVGPTYSEIVKNQLEGTSGILTISSPFFYPRLEKSRRKLVWPNGAQATWLPAKNADKFRGHQYTFVWADEPVAWRGDAIAVYRECRNVNRLASARMRKLGLPARMVITTTPAPTALFREMLSERDGLVLARSSTLENLANLDPPYEAYVRRMMRLPEGRREFMGELSFDLDPALYRGVNWEASRIPDPKKAPKEYDSIIVSVDPATGEKKGADMHGIVVLGVRLEADGLDHVYVLQDASLRTPEPEVWARKAIKALEAWEPFAKKRRGGKPNAWVFAESNTGGSMVKSTLRTVKKVKVLTVRAMQSKAERAAPVSSYAKAGLVHMVGKHDKLEEQLAKFDGREGGHARDDRADAFAWPIYLYVIPKRRNAGAAGRGTTPAMAVANPDDASD